MISAPPSRPIALVGMMGAGKTEVGRALAERLGWPFHDLDDEIARIAGCTVAELFHRDGEPAFRERERRALGSLVTGSRIVLATGGGAFADLQSRTLLLARTLTIWLEAEPATLARRLAGTADRPLVRGGEPLPVLEQVLERRRAFYEQAHLRIRTDGLEVQGVASRLLTMI